MPELDIQGLLEQLAAAAIDYIVIGGVAVGFHGYVRATKDLDVVPAPGRQNLERLAELLRALNADAFAGCRRGGFGRDIAEGRGI